MWYDYLCMPQKDPRATDGDGRWPLEKEEFDNMLKSIVDLYLTCRVLILLDNTYLGRFWTLMEARYQHFGTHAMSTHAMSTHAMPISTPCCLVGK